MFGRLVWNQGRPDIALDTGTLYGGLWRFCVHLINQLPTYLSSSRTSPGLGDPAAM